MKTLGLIAAAALAIPGVAVAQSAPTSPTQSTMPAPGDTTMDRSMTTPDAATSPTMSPTPTPAPTQPSTDMTDPSEDSANSPTSPSTTTPTIPPQG